MGLKDNEELSFDNISSCNIQSKFLLNLYIEIFN